MCFSTENNAAQCKVSRVKSQIEYSITAFLSFDGDGKVIIVDVPVIFISSWPFHSYGTDDMINYDKVNNNENGSEANLGIQISST